LFVSFSGESPPPTPQGQDLFPPTPPEPQLDKAAALRAAVRAAAEAAGWPRVEFRPGEVVAEGEACWSAFLRGAGEEELRAALRVLQGHA